MKPRKLGTITIDIMDNDPNRNMSEEDARKIVQQHLDYFFDVHSEMPDMIDGIENQFNIVGE